MTLNLEDILFYSSIPFLVIALIGNLLVIRIVHKKREMHTPTNYLLVSVAVSDVITILLWSLYFFPFERFICKVVVIVEISITISSITFTVLAVERYHAVLKPFRAGLRLNDDNIKKAIGSTWIAGVVTCFPEFFLKEWSDPYEDCIGPWSLHMNQASKVYTIISTSITCAQLALMIYCYTCLIRGLFFSSTVYPMTDRETTAEKKKLVITFLLATTGFFVGYWPTEFLHSFVAARDDKQIDSKLYSDLVGVFDFIFVCSLCFNPIIYSFRSKKFKEGLKSMFACSAPETAMSNVHWIEIMAGERSDARADQQSLRRIPETELLPKFISIH